MACLLLSGALSGAAHATIDPALLAPLAGDDPDARVEAIVKIGALANDDATRLLTALKNDALYTTADGGIYIVTDDKAYNPATGTNGPLPEGLDGLMVNNRLRGAADDALSALKLFSPDRALRLAAATELQKSVTLVQAPLVEKALAKEQDADIRPVLQLVVATANLQSPDGIRRKAAVEALAESSNANLRPLLQSMLAAESDEGVRVAVAHTLQALDSRLARTEFIGNVFYGISLASVLLLTALGLAITFGLMGIINMAHGALDAYLVLAVPAAFLVAAAVGVALERTVIRWLYGRPLETLLATWGISLILMQAVRTIFGAQNVEVANPSWMSGGVTVLGSLVLAYNRIVIIVFALFVVGGVWLILNKTRLGLFVRAVMQNRRMAGCVGVSTAKIDMMTFGLGSGIAGLGGVALSQLGNVGPDLGQSYIVDSFMVVVLGGVGQLAGTIIAALGLGEANKFLEPVAGAVLAKIAILVFIIMFIQKRPQGLFAMKGRSAE
ncbi:MAG: urea ABC transporter permease subunit UrtB [Pseudomonadota bacterium]